MRGPVEQSGRSPAGRDAGLEPRVAEALRRLGREPAQARRWQLLAAGFSGSRVYRLSLPEGEAVLKVTPREAPAFMLERSRREVAFYESLAPLLPLTVPRVLAARRDPDSEVDLLLEALEPAPPPEEWHHDLAAQAAGQLAGFHAHCWGSSSALDSYPWLRGVPSLDWKGCCRAAQAVWDGLATQPHLRQVLRERRLRRLMGWVERLEGTDELLALFPLTLIHGDCHIGNLLRDRAGRLVWADWQEVGWGRAPADLSFLLQRAGWTSDSPPGAGLVKDYHRALGSMIPEAPPLAELLLALDAVELRVRLLEWPHYLEAAPVGQVEVTVRRAEEAACRLGL